MNNYWFINPLLIILMINIQEELFPTCVVWTTIPVISWIIPVIGHVGICNSKGIVSDFLGYHINYRKLSFNRPLKYVKLTPASESEYDEAIIEANALFESQAHDLCCNNCHHHIADALNRINYENRNDWNQFDIWWMCISRSNYTQTSSIFKIYLPFLVVLAIVGIILAIVIK